MKKLITKTLYFVIPVFCLFCFTKFFYNEKASPDLLRLGYIPYMHKDYSRAFDHVSKEIKYTALTKAKRGSYDVMTIGDSFSEQGSGAYNNYLANDHSVLHVNRFISRNPFQTLIEMSNSDFFDHYPVRYVVLENVERHMFDHTKSLNMEQQLSVTSLDSMIAAPRPKGENYQYRFFSRLTLTFPIYHFPRYFFEKNYLSNEDVYNYDLTSDTLFSTGSNKLFFYHQDVSCMRKNNELAECQKMNDVLNTISAKLAKRGIQLIFLPAPNKLDIYYDHIAQKTDFARPLFFDHFKSFEKNYIYIDSRSILSDLMTRTKDVYYFDDTHWSPYAAEAIAGEIRNSMTNFSD
jgi:hypothetical protein